jgi:hypothetical protein
LPAEVYLNVNIHVKEMYEQDRRGVIKMTSKQRQERICIDKKKSTKIRKRIQKQEKRYKKG